MSKELIIALIAFSIIWLFIILRCVRKEKISVRYSLVWFLMAITILFVGVFPGLMDFISDVFGFATISNLVIGIILTLLMFITLILTQIVTEQKNQIKILTQEVSMLKKDVKNEK